ncbi:autotransporter outer membrane beta-barrel domain-containing protein [Rickettsiaceae bacterium]|nr:autotransporter outer membrane beta-barrel domain-containing protein [Rickettsiaceae bacterium]
MVKIKKLKAFALASTIMFSSYSASADLKVFINDLYNALDQGLKDVTTYGKKAEVAVNKVSRDAQTWFNKTKANVESGEHLITGLGAKLDSDVKGIKNSRDAAGAIISKLHTLTSDGGAIKKTVAGLHNFAENIMDDTKTAWSAASSEFSKLAHNNPGYHVLSAGDGKNIDYLVWLRGSISNIKHKADDDYAAGKYSIQGGDVAFGLNKGFGDGYMLGVFYQYSTSDRNCPSAKHKNKAHSFGLKGNAYLVDNFHLMGIGTYTDLKSTGDDLGTSGKKIQIYNVVGKLGYDFDLGNNMQFMPKLGVQYIHSTRGSYTDTINIAWRSMTSSKVDFVANATFQKAMIYDDIKILGELFANVRTTISDKSDKIQFSIIELGGDIALPVSLSKSTHTDVGTRFVWSKDNYHASATYTYAFAKNENGHIGTLGVKIDF